MNAFSSTRDKAGNVVPLNADETLGSERVPAQPLEPSTEKGSPFSKKLSGGHAEASEVPGRTSDADGLDPADVGSQPGRSRTRLVSNRKEIMEGVWKNLPFMAAGSAMLVISKLLWKVPTKIGTHLYPVWLILFVAGLLALAGGTVASLIHRTREGSTSMDREDNIQVPRSEWKSTTNELARFRSLISKIPPEDLFQAALGPDQSEKYSDDTLDQILESMDKQASKVETLRLALVTKHVGKDDIALSPKRLPSAPSVSRVRETGGPSTPLLESAQSLARHVIRDNSAGSEEESPATSPSSIKFQTVQSSTLEWERAAFQAAYTTGVMRQANETSKDYVLRSALDSARMGRRPPTLRAITRVVSSTLMEARRSLTDAQVNDLSRMLENDSRRWVEETRVARRPGENLIDFATRVRGVLEVQERSGIGAMPMERRLAGLQWSLEIFRTFLESYIGSPETDVLVERVEREAADSGATFGIPAELGEDELVGHARLVKSVLQSLPIDGMTSTDREQMIEDFDAFVEDLKNHPETVLRKAGSPRDRVRELPKPEAVAPKDSSAVAQVADTENPEAEVKLSPVTKDKPLVTGPVVSSSPQVASGTPVGRGDLPEDPVKMETSAFQVAHATGVSRNPNETPTDYFMRVNSVIGSGEVKTNPVKIAMAISTTLREARRTLPERQMAELYLALESACKQWSEEVKIPRIPGERLSDYVERVGEVLEVLGRTATETEPQKDLKGLEWSLTLFRGFLQGYLSRKDAEQVLKNVKERAVAVDTEGQEGKFSEARTTGLYSQLLKNALRELLSSRGFEDSKIGEMLGEFDVFMLEMSAASPKVPGLSQSRKDAGTPAASRLRRMFERRSSRKGAE